MPTTLDLASVAVLAIAWPLYEHFLDWPAFQRRVRRDPSPARLLEYRSSILIQWIFAAAVIAIWVRAGRSWTTLRLSAPTGWRLWMGIVLVVGFAALQGWQLTAIAHSPATKAHLRKRFGEMELAALLPRTGMELGWMFALSLTAGFVEELLFRGYVVAAMAPWWTWWGAAAFSVAAFGVLHAYQGRAGIVRTAAVGAALTLLVAATRSLIPAMVLHALADIASGTAGWLALSDQPAAHPASG